VYAKSMIESIRAELASGEVLHRLSYMPVVLALFVAVLPFTLAVQPHEGPVAEPTEAATAAGESMIRASTVAMPSGAALPEERRYKVIADFMARKYRVSQDVVHELVKTAYAAGRQAGVDPLLIVAVMAVESSFNPIAESVAGAKGLMQIIPKYHPEKFVEFGGEHAIFDPRTNILVGARIIREYLSASSGDIFTALQTYAGALADRDAVYAHRVLNEKDKLDELSGLPKTDRRRVAQLGGPTLQQDGNRVKVTIPAATPGQAVPDASNVIPAPAPAAKPVNEPTA
jgi:hypothetical protein